MGIAVMVFLARTQPGLAKTWWDWHPTGWNPIPIGYFYQLNYHKYLLVAIPGTFIGELLLRQSDIVADVVTTWTKQVSNWICGSSLLIPLCTCAGLYARQIPLTALLLTVYIVAVSLLAGKPQTGLERTIRGLLSWATGLLAAGMFAEPIEGGIRKAEPTISYFLVSGGLACIFLIGLTILHEEFRQDKRLRWVTGTGTNPILGYAVITLLVMGFEGLFNLGDLVGNLREHVFHGNAWFVMCWAAVKTTFIAFFCSKMSQHKLFLRA